MLNHIYASRTLDDFQVLTDFKTMGEHRYEDSFNRILALSQLTELCKKNVLQIFSVGSGNITHLQFS